MRRERLIKVLQVAVKLVMCASQKCQMKGIVIKTKGLVEPQKCQIRGVLIKTKRVVECNCVGLLVSPSFNNPEDRDRSSVR